MRRDRPSRVDDARASGDDDARASARTTSSARRIRSVRFARERDGEARPRRRREASSIRARIHHGDRERAKAKPTSERDARGGERETIDEE
jgi:hypothetical protein